MNYNKYKIELRVVCTEDDAQGLRENLAQIIHDEFELSATRLVAIEQEG